MMTPNCPSPVDPQRGLTENEQFAIAEAEQLENEARAKRVIKKLRKGQPDSDDEVPFDMPCFELNNKDFIRREDTDAEKFRIKYKEATVARSIPPEEYKQVFTK